MHVSVPKIVCWFASKVGIQEWIITSHSFMRIWLFIYALKSLNQYLWLYDFPLNFESEMLNIFIRKCVNGIVSNWCLCVLMTQHTNGRLHGMTVSTNPIAVKKIHSVWRNDWSVHNLIIHSVIEYDTPLSSYYKIIYQTIAVPRAHMPVDPLILWSSYMQSCNFQLNACLMFIWLFCFGNYHLSVA